MNIWKGAIMKKHILVCRSADGLELKRKSDLIKILRSEIKYETAEGVILSAPLYAIYLVNAFFGSLQIIPEHLKK